MKVRARVYLEKVSKYGSGLDLKNPETVLPSTGSQKEVGKGGKKHGKPEYKQRQTGSDHKVNDTQKLLRKDSLCVGGYLL